MGVVKLDERSSPGYNLYVSRNLCLAELMDAEGRVINAWSHRDEKIRVVLHREDTRITHPRESGVVQVYLM